MSVNNDTFKDLYSQLQATKLPIQALRHYLNSIPEEDEHYNLFNILVTKLESEYGQLEITTFKSFS